MRFAGLEQGFSEKFHCYNAPFSLLQRGGIPTISLLQRTLIKMSCNQQLRTTVIKKKRWYRDKYEISAHTAGLERDFSEKFD
jgi:hypothetical protein